jgi:hypothetical protein
MKLSLESNYPFLGALFALALWWYFSPPFPAAEKEFLAAAIGIGAILTGFIATAKAILAALPNDSVMGRLRATGYVKDLISYLEAALYTCLAFSIYGLFGFFLQVDGHAYLNTWYARGWVFLAAYALLAFHRVAQLLLKIIGHEPTPSATSTTSATVPTQLPPPPGQ